MNFWQLMFLTLFFLCEIESGKIRPNFDEIFVNGWDKNESEENEIKIEQNEKSAVEQMGEENRTEQNNEQKREMIHKFDTIKEKLRDKGKYKNKERVKIEEKIGKFLGANRQKIYKWKKELNLNKKKIMKRSFYEKKKSEFIERFDEFKSLYSQCKQKEFVKELGISEETFRRWKKELLPNYLKKHYTNEDKLRKMKQYFEMKEENLKISDKIIAKNL